LGQRFFFCLNWIAVGADPLTPSGRLPDAVFSRDEQLFLLARQKIFFLRGQEGSSLFFPGVVLPLYTRRLLFFPGKSPFLGPLEKPSLRRTLLCATFFPPPFLLSFHVRDDRPSRPNLLYVFFPRSEPNHPPPFSSDVVSFSVLGFELLFFRDQAFSFPHSLRPVTPPKRFPRTFFPGGGRFFFPISPSRIGDFFFA